MIDYFVRPLSGVRSEIGRADAELFAFAVRQHELSRQTGRRACEGPLWEGTLDLVRDYKRARSLTKARLKFTLTGPHMLSKTLLDYHYKDPAALCMAIAQVLACQVREIDANVVQIDEANIPGHPETAAWAAEAILTWCWTRLAALRLCICVSATTAARPFKKARGTSSLAL